jgi:hypothetical protein
MSAPDDPAATSAPSPETIAPETPPPEAAPTGVQAEPTPAAPPAPPPEPVFASTERFLLWRRVLDGALVTIVLLLAFEVGFFPIRNSDLLMHRAVGRLVSEGKFDFQTDPFTYATEGARWVNHSWLFGVFAYGMHQLGERWGPDYGAGALIVMKALLIAALAEIMLRLGRRPGRSLWIPAMSAGIAVLALSPWTLLRPGCVSYLLFGLTLFLLDMPRRRHALEPEKPFAFVNLRWFIPLVCVLWVNTDGWFLLGPALVALYLIGEWLEGSTAPRGSLANLAAVLAVSVVACLANPYHVHAFTLPDHLGLSPAGRELQSILPFSYIFSSPLWHSNIFFQSDISRSVAGLTFYPLVFLGLASFIVTPAALRSWRGPVWGAFFILAAWHGEAVPFFAVVAGPIMSLNYLDALSVAAEAPDDADQRRRVLIVRAFTLLLAFAAFTAGSAGWLHTPVWGQSVAPDSRRPGWWSEFDGNLTDAAQKINDWREKKLVPEDARWFNTSTAAANYFAWYAPGARAFIDTRISLYPADTAADYRDAMESLSTPVLRSDEGEAVPQAEPAWTRVLRDRKIDYVVIGERDLSRRVPFLLQRLINQKKDWTLCHLFGGSAIFGWNSARGGPEAYKAIRYDSGSLAFGPEAKRAPEKRPVPPRDPEWWEIIWQPERLRSPEADNAVAHMLAYEAQSSRRTEEEWRQAAATLAAAPFGGLTNGSAASFLLLLSGTVHDPGAPADLYLAVRAARRALDKNVEDGRAWFRLGQAYATISLATRERFIDSVVPAAAELRRAQTVAALTQAVRLNPELEAAHALLGDQYRNRFIDLTLQHREAQLKAMMARVHQMGARGESAAAVDMLKQEIQKYESLIQNMQAQKKQLEDDFELQSANKSPADRALIAEGHFLAEAALKAAREHLQQMKDGAADPNQVARGMATAVRLLIDTGEIDEARVLVQGDGREILSKARDPRIPVSPTFAADWYRILVDAASGDYEDADTTLKELAETTAKLPVGGYLAAGLGDHLLTQAAEAGHVGGLAARIVSRIRQASPRPIPGAVMTFNQAVQESLAAVGQTADFQTLRGWLALESGDIATARQEMQDIKGRAAKPYTMMNAYRCAPLAEVTLQWTDPYNKPSESPKGRPPELPAK